MLKAWVSTSPSCSTLSLTLSCMEACGYRSTSGRGIIITSATGQFSATAVAVVLVMSAVVIATSRNGDGLTRPRKIHSHVHTVELSEDLEIDSKALVVFGSVDAVTDLSPPRPTGFNSIAAAVSALRRYGCISLMGGRFDETLPIPYITTVMQDLTIRAQFIVSSRGSPRHHQAGRTWAV